MNQFKDVFLGLENRDYSRATTSQKCVRAGGKHNDLENVGFTNRHHTFFEMLGNFSFGDYFKQDAIAYAWELVTSKEWFGIDPEKLYATIFEGEGGIPRDDEAEKFWLDVGVPKERIFAMGLKDNFWQMGDTGPCGPCSEIHYDMGIAASDAGHTDCKFPASAAATSKSGTSSSCSSTSRRPMASSIRCPSPRSTRGMGLERDAAVLQGVISNYDTDLFVPLIKRAAELTGTKQLDEELKREDVEEQHHQAASLRVIADHARAATFLISDGVLPMNEGRGYVLRKIIRRRDSSRTPARCRRSRSCIEMVFAVRDMMKDAYPELIESASRVQRRQGGRDAVCDRVRRGWSYCVRAGYSKCKGSRLA